MKKKNETREANDIRFSEPDVKAASPPDLETRGEELPPEVAEDRVTRPGFYWPKEKPRPQKFVRRQLSIIPCERCDRVKTDYGTRAVVADRGVSEASGKAYLSCRVCRHTFTLPLEKRSETT